MDGFYRRMQSGNIMLALFAAIGAVGIVGATGMTVLKGPVRSMHNVTQKTIAENNMIASSKLAVMAAANQASGGDCDGDNTVEPVAWSTTGTGPFPTGGGYLPSNIGASLQDPWGNTYGYCVWDHGAAIQTTCPTPTQRLQGEGVGGSGPVISIISSGADRVFQTTCANAPTYVTKVSGSDDIVLSYTYAEAQSASGGLWNLQSSDLDTAEIQKNLEVKNALGTTTFDLDRETGIGDFIGIRTGSIAAKGVEPVIMAGGLKMDNDTNVTQCALPQHKGILRYHMDDGLQVCDGTAWVSAGGGAVPAGTIAAFASNTCPGGWSEYSPARGRFLRGRDSTGTNDAVRNAGDIQTDSNKSHSHTGTADSGGAHGHTGTADAAGAHTPTGSTNTAGSHTHTLSGRGDNNSHYVYGAQLSADNNVTTSGAINAAGAHAHTVTMNAVANHTHGVTIASGGAHPHALTINADGGTETRPKNVAVTFCQYDGGAPVTAIAGLDNLSDVVLSAPQVGQVLTYDGTSWINDALTSSQWITSGANIYYNTGNVGIGTISPATKLHVQGTNPTLTLQDTKLLSDPTLTAGMLIKDSAGASVGYMGDGGTTSNLMQIWAYADRIALGTALAHPITFHTNYNPAPSLDASERMRITSDGKVGIGTLAPASKLSVAGTGAILNLQSSSHPKSNMALSNYISFTDSANAGIGYVGDGSSSENGMHLWAYDDLVRVGTSTAYPITFHTDYNAGGGADASEKMRIASNGNIGIGGVTNPTGHIHIMGKDSASPIIIDRPFHGPSIVMRNIAGPATVNSYPNVTDKWEIYPNGVSAGSSASRLSFVSRTAAEVPTTQLSITNAGILNVTGGLTFSGGRGGLNYYNVSPYDQVELGVSNSFPSTSLSFFTNSVSRMNITPAGNVGIGTVSPYNKLHVIGAIGATDWVGAGCESNCSDVPSGYVINYADGRVVATSYMTASAYNTWSDYRLKDNIRPLEGALDTVLSLKPSRFVLKADKEGKEVNGFIAHEIQEVLPYAVRGEKDAVDDEGKPKYQSVDQSMLPSILTAAIQELKTLFDGLLERMTSMSGENEHLKAEIKRLSDENEAMRTEFNERLKVLEASGSDIKP